MRNLFDPVRAAIAEQLHSILPVAEEQKPSLQELHDALVEPPNPEMGDLAFGCFQLAKALRKGPPQISGEVAKAVVPNDLIESAVAAGPYVNFRLKPAGVGKWALDSILNGSYFKTPLFSRMPKTMIEYSQPNTHKELHVGHMRNACLGDALIRTLRYSGTEIISSTFPGDVGTHVAKCLWYMKFHNTDPVPVTKKGEWLGHMYSKAHLKLEDELGTAKEAENREKLTEILKQLELKKGEYYDLWSETREWSIELMKSVYGWMEIVFDHWYWESEVDSPSLEYVKKLFEEGKLIRSEGAVGMDLADVNLGFCLLLKSDGTGLYATKDLELARRKFQDHKIQKNVVVVDQRQALHFSQVFEVLKRLGFEQAKDCFHLQYNFVELPDGAMSSRKGNIVPIMALIESMQKMVKDNYLERYKGEWSEDEINLVASQVAKGAIKYGMVKIDNNKKIVFDMAEWLKLDGDSGPFIQYSTARISSLLKKLGPLNKKIDWSLLSHPAERKLMSHLIHFNQVVAQAAENYRPSVICTYLLETAKKFNHFYHECSIGQAQTSELKNSRLALALATREVLKNGLGLLGIPAPERM
ncbi:MAG: arginine--tRNA ligase [Bdellovibrio sp.]